MANHADAYDSASRLTALSRTDGYSLTLDYDATGARYSLSDSSGLANSYFPGVLETRTGSGSIRLIRGPGADGVLAEVSAGSGVGLGFILALLRSEPCGGVTHEEQAA